MVSLATSADCVVSAVHVHHGLRDTADDDADIARATADRLGIGFRCVRVELADGPNLEARAREARREALGADAMYGHTADDQAETVLLALLRGTGAAGLAAIEPGWRHPILALRTIETQAFCAASGFVVAADASNADPRFRRNRVRHELLPMLDDIAERDVALLLNRTADLIRRDDRFLEELAAAIDYTDVRQLGTAPWPLAARAVRHWLEHDGYPPDSAAIARVLDVARGRSAACEVTGGRRVERRGDTLFLVPAPIA